MWNSLVGFYPGSKIMYGLIKTWHWRRGFGTPQWKSQTLSPELPLFNLPEVKWKELLKVELLQLPITQMLVLIRTPFGCISMQMLASQDKCLFILYNHQMNLYSPFPLAFRFLSFYLDLIKRHWAAANSHTWPACLDFEWLIPSFIEKSSHLLHPKVIISHISGRQSSTSRLFFLGSIQGCRFSRP